MVKRFFRDITTGRLRCGVCTRHNTKPKPFIWTNSVRHIL